MFAVIEMQTTNGVTAVVPPATYADRNQAEAKFHTILASAAVSAVEIHSCAVLDERGVAILNHCYYHPLPEPEPEEEAETEEEAAEESEEAEATEESEEVEESEEPEEAEEAEPEPEP